MAITGLTLSAAINSYQTQFAISSTSAVTAGNFQTGSGITYLFIGTELMLVTAVPVSGTVNVIRGYAGTIAASALVTAPVLAGGPSDFPQFQPAISAFTAPQPSRYGGIMGPVASAATIVAPGARFHVTGTTATNIITPPTNFVEGEVTIIADGVWTFTSSAVANGIFQSGTVTTAGSAISFIYDGASARWYPSRLA